MEELIDGVDRPPAVARGAARAEIRIPSFYLLLENRAVTLSLDTTQFSLTLPAGRQAFLPMLAARVPVVDLVAALRASVEAAKARRAQAVPHDHREPVDGCPRCELSADELR